MRHRPDGPSDPAPDVPVSARPDYASRDERPRRRPGHDRHLGRRPRGRRRARSGRRPGGPWRGRAPLSLGVGDQARDRVGRPDRGRQGTARSRRAGGSARSDGPPSARPRVGAAVRGSGQSSRRPARGGSTRTRGSMRSGSWSRSGRAGRSRQSSATGSWDRSGWRTRAWTSGLRRGCMGRSATSPRSRRSCSGRHSSRRRRPRRPPRSRSRVSSVSCPASAVRPLRLGPRSRTPRRQDAALDGRPEQPGDVRAFRRRGDVPLDRSGCGVRARRADRPRIRSVGARRVAAFSDSVLAAAGGPR